MTDPSEMTDQEISAELGSLAPKLAEAYATGARASLLEARQWRLRTEQTFRKRRETIGRQPVEVIAKQTRE
jgi:hypothetical protein